MDRMVRARLGAQSTEMCGDCALILQTGRHVSFTDSVAVVESKVVNERKAMLSTRAVQVTCHSVCSAIS
jgi:hypothetical protein